MHSNFEQVHFYVDFTAKCWKLYNWNAEYHKHYSSSSEQNHSQK